MCTTKGIADFLSCFSSPHSFIFQNNLFVLYFLYTSVLFSFPLSQTLTEPAIFARETSCDCRAPHEKLTIAQARRGTPGLLAWFLFFPPAFTFIFITFSLVKPSSNYICYLLLLLVVVLLLLFVLLDSNIASASVTTYTTTSGTTSAITTTTVLLRLLLLLLLIVTHGPRGSVMSEVVNKNKWQYYCITILSIILNYVNYYNYYW